jgi:hypothetical protein
MSRKMKDATLLDMAVRETYAKHPLVKPEIRHKLMTARKFVLSETMSSYLADMTCAPFAQMIKAHSPLPPLGSVQARIDQRSVELMEAARHLATAPHALTWIEYDTLARRRRSRTEYRNFVGTSSGYYEDDDNNICPRTGWLIEQHPGIPTAFTMLQISHVGLPGQDDHAAMMPFAMNWLTDDASVLPWRDIPFGPKNRPSVIATGITVYMTDRVGISFAPTYNTKFDANAMSEMLRESVGELRAVWMFLATLNDIPTTYDHVRPSKGYVAKGQYRRFSEHTVITLNIPAHRSLKTLAARVLTNLRRRAHNVRGFWRIDFRHPPATQCAPHAWFNINDRTIECSRCGGRMFRITEHVRGDASRGFVLHDYVVEKGQEKST